ncbi:MAG: LysR family glycine cleavage system transcriptional activator [Gammaproteobacteria bacterium]|jgi:LysR family glycine cleavage system transcriptional activator
MSNSLPHLRGLQIFEAVARHRSMTRAGRELAIGQSAVTQQIGRLEDYFDRRLVERSASGIRLTEFGERLGRQLRPPMDDIRAAIAEALEDRHDSLSVSVIVLGAFAYRWLIPRLASFHRSHPGIDVQVITTSSPNDLLRDDVDVSIRTGAGTWPGCRAEYLMANELFPVISPRLLRKSSQPQIADLSKHAWIHIDAESRQLDWQTWINAAGRIDLHSQNELHVASSVHALEAAIAGLGIAIAHSPFVADALQAGHLVALEPAFPAPEGDYYIVSTERRADAAQNRLFRSWLLREAL